MSASSNANGTAGQFRPDTSDGKRFKAGVLGATGLVGQRLVNLLANVFEIVLFGNYAHICRGTSVDLRFR